MRNFLIAAEKPFLADVFYTEKSAQPVVIFCHGFKGFKDWGCFDLMAKKMAEAGFCFVKFNFSHNGTTKDSPTDFVDLAAFGNNTFSKEIADVQAVIAAIGSKKLPINSEYYDAAKIYIAGHSRGGGIALLSAAFDAHITKVATMASVSLFGNFFSKEKMYELKKNGVIYIANERTKQQMPIYQTLYDDLAKNAERYHILSQIKNLHKPILLLHGMADAAVSYQSAEQLKAAQPNAELVLLPEANHVFGAKHPYSDAVLPKDFTFVVDKMISFFNQ